MVHGSFCEEANAAKASLLPTSNAIVFSQKLPCTTCNVKFLDMLNVCMLCQTLTPCDWRRLEFIGVFALSDTVDCSRICPHSLHVLSNSCHQRIPVQAVNTAQTPNPSLHLSGTLHSLWTVCVHVWPRQR